MSIKQVNNQSRVKNRYSNGFPQLTSGRHTTSKNDKPILPNNTGALVKKPPKLLELSKQKRQIAPDKLKLIRHVFTTISNSPSMPVERLIDALLALDHDPRKDVSYQEFLTEHEVGETFSSLLDFERFALLVLEYEEKLRVEDEALRRLDLKIAFECFDINKDGMIDANELSVIMNILSLPTTDREAKEMIEFADHDKDSLLSFDEFLTVLTQISAIYISQSLPQ